MQIAGDQRPTFEEFMGRERVKTEEEKFDEFWELLKRDRASKTPKVTVH